MPLTTVPHVQPGNLKAARRRFSVRQIASSSLKSGRPLSTVASTLGIACATHRRGLMLADSIPSKQNWSHVVNDNYFGRGGKFNCRQTLTCVYRLRALWWAKSAGSRKVVHQNPLPCPQKRLLAGSKQAAQSRENSRLTDVYRINRRVRPVFAFMTCHPILTYSAHYRVQLYRTY